MLPVKRGVELPSRLVRILILFSFLKYKHSLNIQPHQILLTTHLLLHPVEQLTPLLPEPVHGGPGVDVPLSRHLQPGQVGVLLTDGATEGLLSSERSWSDKRQREREGLRSYFNSKSSASCPLLSWTRLLNCFSMLMTWFLSGLARSHQSQDNSVPALNLPTGGTAVQFVGIL